MTAFHSTDVPSVSHIQDIGQKLQLFLTNMYMYFDSTGMIPLDFTKLFSMKTSVSIGYVVESGVSMQYQHVTDKQTNRQTSGHSLYHSKCVAHASNTQYVC